jgi:hypothetical protein
LGSDHFSSAKFTRLFNGADAFDAHTGACSFKQNECISSRFNDAIPKMILIAAELTLNVFLFYFLAKRIKHLFPAVFLSIVISKTVYYILKFLMIQLTIINTGLITTPILIQIVTAMLFSFYLVAFYEKQDINS